jgi:hypothetical protein
MGEDAVGQALTLFHAAAEDRGVGGGEAGEGFVGAIGEGRGRREREAGRWRRRANSSLDLAGQPLEEVQRIVDMDLDALGLPITLFDGVERLRGDGIGDASVAGQVAGDLAEEAFEGIAGEIVAEEDERFGGEEGAHDIADRGEARDEAVEVIFGDDQAIGLREVALQFDQRHLGGVEEGDVGIADDQDVGFAHLIERLLQAAVEAVGDDLGGGEDGISDEVVDGGGMVAEAFAFLAQGGDEGAAPLKHLEIAGDGGQAAIGALVSDARGQSVGDLLGGRRALGRLPQAGADEEDRVVADDQLGKLGDQIGHWPCRGKDGSRSLIYNIQFYSIISEKCQSERTRKLKV